MNGKVACKLLKNSRVTYKTHKHEWAGYGLEGSGVEAEFRSRNHFLAVSVGE
jgi:hypothetical protein